MCCVVLSCFLLCSVVLSCFVLLYLTQFWKVLELNDLVQKHGLLQDNTPCVLCHRVVSSYRLRILSSSSLSFFVFSWFLLFSLVLSLSCLRVCYCNLFWPSFMEDRGGMYILRTPVRAALRIVLCCVVMCCVVVLCCVVLCYLILSCLWFSRTKRPVLLPCLNS
jgi:hypothetical protein